MHLDQPQRPDNILGGHQILPRGQSHAVGVVMAEHHAVGTALEGCRHHILDLQTHPVAGAVPQPEQPLDAAAAIQRSQQGAFLHSPGKLCHQVFDQLVEYLMAQFAGTVQERALLAALDGRSRIKGLFWLRDGTSDRVSLEIKDVVAAALKGGTDSVVLCHNHPNGVALPSREDLMATENIVRALGLVKVHLRDHIILTESEYFSMREANRLPFYDFQTGEMLRPY